MKTPKVSIDKIKIGGCLVRVSSIDVVSDLVDNEYETSFFVVVDGMKFEETAANPFRKPGVSIQKENDSIRIYRNGYLVNTNDDDELRDFVIFSIGSHRHDAYLKKNRDVETQRDVTRNNYSVLVEAFRES